MSTATEFTTATNVSTSADRLRQSFSAMRVAFTWLGMRKSLSTDQRQQAASQFGAEQKFISAGKKLIDTGHPGHEGGQPAQTANDGLLEEPEPALSRVRYSAGAAGGRRPAQRARWLAFQQQLEVAVRELEACYEEIKEQARSDSAISYSRE